MLNRTITAVAATTLALTGAAAGATAHAEDVPPNAGTNSFRVDKAAFVTPSGNMACVMDESGVTCNANEHDWPKLQVQCEEGEGGNLMRLTDVARASCIGDPLKLRALKGDSPLTAYHDQLGPQRHDVTFPGEQGTYAGVDYGTYLHNGKYSVDVEADGVTARNLENGHSFHMSKQVVETR